jgi:hypothetical protein
MKPRRRLIQAFIAAILLAVGITLAVWILSCPRDIDVSIGEFESKQAALPKLSAEISRCPQAEQYRVSWIASDLAMRQAVLYIRKPKMLGYEQDCYSGFSDWPYNVDDVAIRTVAEKGGKLEDFQEYDQRTR